MPVYRRITDALHTQIALWDITEDEDYFHQRTPLHPDDAAALQASNPTRRLESLASRYALYTLLTDPNSDFFLQKDNCKKPFLVHFPHLYCSISHTRGIAAAMISPSNCGIDIQAFSPKIPKLVPRFLHPDELADVEGKQMCDQDRIDRYHFLWSAKETLYKIWGKLELDFRQQMRIIDLQLPTPTHAGTCKGTIRTPLQTIHCALLLHKMELCGQVNYLCYGMTID